MGNDYAKRLDKSICKLTVIIETSAYTISLVVFYIIGLFKLTIFLLKSLDCLCHFVRCLHNSDLAVMSRAE